MKSPRGTVWVIGQLILLAAIVLVPSHFNGLPSLPDSQGTIDVFIGLIIAIFGIVVGLLSALSLGPNLTIFPRPVENGSLQQTGIYGLVRHPIYSGVLLTALGWSIARSSIPSLLITLVLFIFFDRKAHQEEQWLQQKFPQYAEYRKRVRKLIPWLY